MSTAATTTRRGRRWASRAIASNISGPLPGGRTRQAALHLRAPVDHELLIGDAPLEAEERSRHVGILGVPVRVDRLELLEHLLVRRAHLPQRLHALLGRQRVREEELERAL